MVLGFLFFRRHESSSRKLALLLQNAVANHPMQEALAMTTPNILQSSSDHGGEVLNSQSGLEGALSNKQRWKKTKQVQMKSHSEGLWPNLLSVNLKNLLKLEEVLNKHKERNGNLASGIFHSAVTQARKSQ